MRQKCSNISVQLQQSWMNSGLLLKFEPESRYTAEEALQAQGLVHATLFSVKDRCVAARPRTLRIQRRSVLGCGISGTVWNVVESESGSSS